MCKQGKAWRDRKGPATTCIDKPAAHSRVHVCVSMSAGDEDMEGWFFGDHTLNAVMAYQASMRLPETGEGGRLGISTDTAQKQV